MRAQACALRAQAHERLRHYPEALAQAAEALELDPRRTSARVTRALALFHMGQRREAEGELEQATVADPGCAAARLQLGFLRLCLGDRARVASTLQTRESGSALRSEVGAAKAYIALAAESDAELSGDGRQGRRAEEAV